MLEVEKWVVIFGDGAMPIRLKSDVLENLPGDILKYVPNERSNPN